MAEVPFDEAPLRALAASWEPGAPFEITEMPGGASLRRFFRVRSGNGKRAVGMFVPDAAPEEAMAPDQAPRAEWPFIEVLRLLAGRGVRMPALLGDNTAQGWLLVEDLGDSTLADYLLTAPDRKTAVYETAVADLAAAQLALAELPTGSIVGQRRFDPALLHWEVDHFREWGLLARGIQPNAAQTEQFQAAAHGLAELISGFPYGFTHRDYQSRNLMVLGNAAEGEKLAWVDFQDAMLGPRVYDLVALLRDSYQSFEEDFIERRLRQYVQAKGLPATEYDEVRREFDLISIQRKLKDAGRFVFIEHKKGDSSYLKFIDPSLRLVRGAMQRTRDVPCIAQLQGVLDELAVWPE